MTTKIPIPVPPKKAQEIIEALENGGAVEIEFAPEEVREHEDLLRDIAKLHHPEKSIRERAEELRDEAYQAEPDDFSDEIEVEEYD